jgi:hypothetical protein
MNANYRSLMKAARKRIRAFDKSDGSDVTKVDTDLALRTIMSAISSGIETNMWDVIADAQVMLSQLELKHRPPALRGNGYFLEE